MSTISVTVPTSLSPADVKSRIDAQGAALAQKYGLAIVWTSDTTATLHRSGLSGQVNLQPGSITVDLDLSFLLSMVSGKIEAGLRNQLADALSAPATGTDAAPGASTDAPPAVGTDAGASAAPPPGPWAPGDPGGEAPAPGPWKSGYALPDAGTGNKQKEGGWWRGLPALGKVGIVVTAGGAALWALTRVLGDRSGRRSGA